MLISLIICTLNEEQTVHEVINKSCKYVDEIIVVDGHSNDNTAHIAENLGAKVILDEKKGKGNAIRIALNKAKGDILVFMDADGSHDSRDIPSLIKPIILNKADLVIASRKKGGSDELSGSLEKSIRLIGSSIIDFIINLRFKSNITDSQNGFRAIRKSAVDKLYLKEDIFTIEQEMVIKTLEKGFIVTEIPSHEFVRQYGKSRINLIKVSWRYVWCLLKNII